MIATVFFASPDFSGIGPFLLVVYTCLPVFILAAFHGRNVLWGVLQAVLLGAGLAIQWKLFRNFSTPIRVSSAIASYFVINLLSAILTFLLVVFFTILSHRTPSRSPEIGTAEQRERITNASKLGDTETVKALLKENPDLVFSKDKLRRETPLHWAANKEVVELLLANRAQVDAKGDNNGDTPLGEAAENGRTDVAEVLLAHGANVNVTNVFNFTPLFEAVGQNHPDIVKLLLDHHANGNTYGDMGLTALDMAAKHGQKDLVELLLSKGIDINYVSDDGTSLHKAVAGGDIATASLLISYHADVNAKDFHKDTPLHFAAGNRAIAELLLNNRADISARDDSGQTPLHWAAKSSSAGVAELLLADKAEVDPKDKSGMTPLHYAASAGSADTVATLLAGKADISAEDGSGKSPLHYAAASGGIEAAKNLLAQSAAINAKDQGGRTPLHEAVWNGRREMVEYLLANHADLNAKDDMGMTPLGLAKKAYAEITDTSGQRKARFGGPTPEDYANILQLLKQQGGS